MAIARRVLLPFYIYFFYIELKKYVKMGLDIVLYIAMCFYTGGLAEWSKAAVLKTVGPLPARRFESCVLRHALKYEVSYE